MIIAGILFLLGVLLGMTYGYAAIMAASSAVTVLLFSFGFFRSFVGLCVWIGYLLALQSGFLLGAYLATPDENK